MRLMHDLLPASCECECERIPSVDPNEHPDGDDDASVAEVSCGCNHARLTDDVEDM
jgi:hypothetical protein